MYTSYCRILGVNQNASMAEIRRAFRAKAKLYHPDLNDSPEAHQEFIRLKQAFDFVIKHKDFSRQRLKTTVYANNEYRKRYNREFDWENFYKWKEAQQNIRNKKKQEIDYKKTLFGKIVFYFFHLVFILIGFYILIEPVRNLIVNGVDPDRSVFGSVFAVILSCIIGTIMVVMMFLSGINYNFKIKFK